METNKNSPRSTYSLTTTLALAFLILSVTTLLVSGSITLYANVQRQQQTFVAQQQFIAQNASEKVSSFFEANYKVLESTAKIYEFPAGSTEQKNLILKSLLSAQPSFRQLTVLNATGQEVTQASRVAIELSDQFKAQLQKVIPSETKPGQRYISQIYFDDATHEPLIVLAIPVDIWDFRGALAAEVNLQFMWSLVDQLKIGDTGYLYIVDSEGNLIAFKDTDRVLSGENVKQIKKVNEFIEHSSSLTPTTPNLYAYTGLQGDRVVGTYVPLGTPQWAVITELPYSEAYRPVFQAITTSLITMLVMGLLAGLAGVILARRLAIPLINLTGIAARVAAGETKLQATVGGAKEIAILATAFNTMTKQLRDLIGSLEHRVADRTKALATSAEVSRRLSILLERKQLVTEVVDQVRNAFNYYHAQIYFYNPAKDELVMAGGTGEAGQILLAQGHKISKGKGLVGRAADTNSPVLVSDTSKDPDWLPNLLLPETKSEAAIPIAVGDQVLGVLDVQHNLTDGLKQEDVDLLQSIASQVAIAMQNIASAEIVTKRATELQTVAAISTAAARIRHTQDMLAAVVRLTQSEFGFYHAHIFLHDPQTSELKIAACGWKEGDPHQGTHETTVLSLDQQQSLVARAAHTRQPIIVNDIRNEPGWLPNPLLPDTAAELAVPLIVGDQLVGVLDVQSDRRNAFTNEDANILTTLATQTATALQNATSYVQEHRQAERETKLNDISQKIQSATTIEMALQIAVRELGHALGKRPTRVKLASHALPEERGGSK